MVLRLVLSAVLLSTVAPPPPSAVAQSFTGLRLVGTIAHGTGVTAYTGRLSGGVDLTLGPSQATLTLAPGGCFTTLAWALATATDGRTTLVVETCLTAPGVTATALDSFMSGQGGSDPSFSFSLIPGATPPVMTNPTTVVAQLFVRGCTGNAYRRHADLVLAPGAAQLRPFTDADGVPQVELLPTTASLVDPDPALWADVLDDCRGADRMLPSTASPGATSDLAGTTVPPPGPPGPHEDIAQLARDVSDLVAGGQLASGYARPLLRALDKAAFQLRAGRARKAIKKLTRFTRRVEVFVARAALPPAEGQTLIDGGTVVAGDIAAFAFSGPARFLPAGCGSPPPCDPTVYHVRAGAGAAPDGTVARPFPTIVAALAAAEAAALCGVEVQVADGTYPEDLVITRDTAIFGASRNGVHLPATILNEGPHEVNLARLVIDGSSILGAVVVDDPCATTTIAGVRIEDAQRWGVWQQGGTLEVVDVTVRGTGATGGNVAYGTGVYLTGGVEATLVGLDLLNNEGGGLVATGVGTDVSAHGVVAEGNRTNSFFADELVSNVEYGGGGARASDRAVLVLQSSALSRNENFGLLVDNGATATFEHGTIESTRQVGGVRGYNVLVVHAGALELVDFVSERAALAGIGLADAEVDAHDGEVSHCPIGVYVSSEAFDLGRLRDVRYIDNDRNLDSSVLPVPEPVAGA
jgi:hypothetical protein